MKTQLIDTCTRQIWSGGQHQLLLGWAATDDIGAEEGLDEDEGAQTVHINT